MGSGLREGPAESAVQVEGAVAAPEKWPMLNVRGVVMVLTTLERACARNVKPDYCENRLLAICFPDAPLRTGTCPGIMESGTVLKRSKGEVHSHLRKP